MARPTANLDELKVPKAGETPPPPTHSEAAPKGYAHTLSLRLTADDYRSLRRYVAAQEEKTGKRISQQSVIEGLLLGFLKEASKG